MTIEDVLNDIGLKIVNASKSNLQKAKKIATGKLYKSVDYEIEDGILSFNMEEYGFYIDQGRNSINNPISDRKKPKGVPSEPLREWMKLKGIDLKYEYVISMAIKKKGFKGGPTNFFSDPYETYMNNLDAEIDKALSDSLDDIIDSI